MKQSVLHPLPHRRHPRGVMALLAIAGVCIAAPAWAGQSEAEAAIGRAAAKVEIVTRQSGIAGNQGDQSFTMARQRLDAARDSLKNNHYDSAEMLADEASVLAELTVEKANLAALQTSHDNVVKAAAPLAPAS